MLEAKVPHRLLVLRDPRWWGLLNLQSVKWSPSEQKCLGFRVVAPKLQCAYKPPSRGTVKSVVSGIPVQTQILQARGIYIFDKYSG